MKMEDEGFFALLDVPSNGDGITVKASMQTFTHNYKTPLGLVTNIHKNGNSLLSHEWEFKREA